jgi:tetratricopeptide (TPR) repeat protein
MSKRRFPWRKAFGLVVLLSLFSSIREVSAQSSDTADEAELRFQLGAEAYQTGDYRRALEHFLVSNRLSPNQNVTFNIARAYQKIQRYPEAYRYYQVALGGKSTDTDRKSLQQALLDLEQSVVVLNVRTIP